MYSGIYNTNSLQPQHGQSKDKFDDNAGCSSSVTLRGSVRQNCFCIALVVGLIERNATPG
jgi:hypothetical protein